MSDDERAQAARPDPAARRSRLRQYQVQLLERMQAAKGQGAVRASLLGVQVGERRYLLELTQAGEIVPLSKVTKVPLTHDWYLGLANIRGSLVGIIDIARYDGMPGVVAGPEARLVSFAGALGFNCALLVTRVVGLRQPGQMQAQDNGGWCDADGQQWHRLDLAALAQEARFLHVGL